MSGELCQARHAVANVEIEGHVENMKGTSNHIEEPASSSWPRSSKKQGPYSNQQLEGDNFGQQPKWSWKQFLPQGLQMTALPGQHITFSLETQRGEPGYHVPGPLTTETARWCICYFKLVNLWHFLAQQWTTNNPKYFATLVHLFSRLCSPCPQKRNMLDNWVNGILNQRTPKHWG